MPTDPGSAAAVGRLYGALKRALADRSGSASPAEVTVSEIYQTLVPYARARADLGFEMNADYEHALMRLLAGEGGYARLEEPEARARISRELESPNPDVTLYRKYAASTLRLAEPLAASASPGRTTGVNIQERPTRAPDPGGSPPGPEAGGGAAAYDSGGLGWGQALDRIARGAPPEPTDAAAERALDDGLAKLSSVIHGGPASGRASALTGEALQGEAAEVSVAEAAVAAETTGAEEFTVAIEEGPPAAGSLGGHPAECGSCGKDLPTDREVRFCPYCGSEQPRVCAGCGDSLEAEWSFCPSCGSEI
ncbi:MAG TPA: zinc ribbon domain-containing protein [Longimicrobiales bacterium]|nr:zinc ribbon domain-containing protein [Longimicrobiales bacterium]